MFQVGGWARADASRPHRDAGCPGGRLRPLLKEIFNFILKNEQNCIELMQMSLFLESYEVDEIRVCK